mmetsp:Transcript_4744/g.9338  ORF Transcript_4744/g.9338 Transcript_4744/m.9338 type:complete len:247 (-) Transcript_4744:2807-3547(-)
MQKIQSPSSWCFEGPKNPRGDIIDRKNIVFAMVTVLGGFDGSETVNCEASCSYARTSIKVRIYSFRILHTQRLHRFVHLVAQRRHVRTDLGMLSTENILIAPRNDTSAGYGTIEVIIVETVFFGATYSSSGASAAEALEERPSVSGGKDGLETSRIVLPHLGAPDSTVGMNPVSSCHGKEASASYSSMGTFYPRIIVAPATAHAALARVKPNGRSQVDLTREMIPSCERARNGDSLGRWYVSHIFF